MRKRTFQLGLITLMLSFSLTNGADAARSTFSTGNLSLPQALQFAEERNPQLVAARKNMDLSTYDISIAKEIPNPQLQYSAVSGNIYRVLGTADQMNLNQTIETDGKRRKRTQAAQSQYKLTAEQYNAQRWDIRQQVRQAYSDLAAAEESITLIDVQAKLAQQLVDIADKRVKAGAAPVSEMLQAKLALNQLDTQKNQADSQLRQARIHFNGLLGNNLLEDTDTGYEISDEGYFKLSAQKTELVPAPEEEGVPTLDALYQKAAEVRPDLKAAVQQIKVYQDQLVMAKAERVPDLQLSGGYLYTYAPTPYSAINKKQFFSGPLVQIGFNLPVFHNQGAEIGKAQTSIVQAQLQLTAIQKQLIDDIHTAYTALKTARENIRLYQQKLLPDSADVLHLAQESYQYGKTGLANVILAQQADQQNMQNYIQSVTDYQTAWGSLERAVGMPLVFNTSRGSIKP
jgi:outer membrane protein, heavy metal efflux system